MVDALGNRTTSSYNGRGLLTSTRVPWGDLTSYGYDAVGNVTVRVDGRDLRTSTTYDALDRPSVVLNPEGTRSSFAYDALSQLLTVADSAGMTSTSYDAVGQVTGVAYPAGARLSYAYDSIGNRLWMADDTGARTTYSYAPVTGTGTNYLLVAPPYESLPNNRTEVRFDKLGRVDFKEMKEARASKQTQRFGANGWKSYNAYTSFSGVEQNYFPVGYDRVGNRTSLAERNGGGGSPTTYTYFGYDASNQLINERRQDTPGFNTTYTYDGVGNRLVQNAGGVLTTYLYGSGNRLLKETTGSAVTSYSYDQNGNTTLINAAGSLTTYAWDGENRLKQVIAPDGSSEKHEYDANGLRRRKSVTSPSSVVTTTVFVWDGMSLVQERNESNLLLAQYTWAPESWNGFWSGGELMDVLFLERRASTPGDMVNAVSRYHGEDPSYNTRLLIDMSGNVSDRFSFKSFGEVFGHSGSGTTPFLFGGAVGYYADALRRTYVRNRVVDPTTGRWITPDPIGFDGGDWNLWRYVENDPIGWIDPSGLAAAPPPAPEPCPPPPGSPCAKAYLTKSYTCGGFGYNSPKRTCNPKNAGYNAILRSGDSRKICYETRKRLRANISCLMARYAVTELCYGGVQNQRHYDEELNVYRDLFLCAGMYTQKGCGKTPKLPRKPSPIPNYDLSPYLDIARRLLAAGIAIALIISWLAEVIAALKAGVQPPAPPPLPA